MEKELIKFINAQQAKSVHLYKNTKEKLLKIIAAIWFNKMYRLNHFTPKYNTSIITLSGPLIQFDSFFFVFLVPLQSYRDAQNILVINNM
jgi:hypothetical protein